MSDRSVAKMLFDPVDSSGTFGSGSTHAKSAALPVYWTWMWAVTIALPSLSRSTANRRCSPAWVTGVWLQKNPPQASARCAGSRDSKTAAAPTKKNARLCVIRPAPFMRVCS